MKKAFASLLIIVLCLCCLVSCGSYKENEWFSEEKLDECLVPELPRLEKSFIGDGNNVCVSFSNTEFNDYVQAAYGYLKSQEFEYLGTRGAIKSSLAGLFTTYYFEPAEELDDFLVNGNYIFVYSDGTLDETGDPIFCILAIRYYGKTTIEYDRNKTFTYTAEISLSNGSEFALGGRYDLPEEDEDASAILCDYEPWLATLDGESVKEIKTTQQSVGVPPGALKDIRRTEDKEVIADLIELYKCATMTPITREEAEIDGGSAFTVEFILTDGTTKALSFNNGNYAYYGVTHHDSPLYYFNLDSIPTLEATEKVSAYHSFVTYIDTGTVYAGDTQIGEISVGALEFRALNEKIGLPDREMYVVTTEFGKLIFQTEDIFYVEGAAGVYYRLAGELMQRFE